jgi:hypothetical protein
MGDMDTFISEERNHRVRQVAVGKLQAASYSSCARWRKRQEMESKRVGVVSAVMSAVNIACQDMMNMKEKKSEAPKRD